MDKSFKKAMKVAAKVDYPTDSQNRIGLAQAVVEKVYPIIRSEDATTIAELRSELAKAHNEVEKANEMTFSVIEMLIETKNENKKLKEVKPSKTTPVTFTKKRRL